MENTLIKNPIILQILEKYRIIWALNHLGALGHWDMETYMPQEGARARAEALAKISVLNQSLFLEKDFVSLIHEVEGEKLNDNEKAIIRVLKRTLKYYQKLPPDFIEEFTRVVNESNVEWRKARSNNDFSLFAPYLEKIINLSKKKADLLGYTEHPYDALLDEFEEGLTTKEVEAYFSKIKGPLISLLNYIKASSKYKIEHELEKESYDTARMSALNHKLLKKIHYNLNHLRLDVSAHPFSSSIAPSDVRMTTRYEGTDFTRTYSSVMHEYGHALYDLQSHEDLYFTPIHGGSSLIIHESQSRFWENIVGKSKEFLQSIYEDIVEASPELKKYSIDQIYTHINRVKPGLIRVDADEVTYHLHIMIRFEVEKALIEGRIKVSELAEFWNDKYESYLGIRPKTYSEGILQDVHWSHGSVGYFPTYSMGSALSAVWKKEIEGKLGKISDLVQTEEGIRKIQNWLKDHIHQHGSTYLYQELVMRISKREFKPEELIEYLEEKYKNLY
ncbi:MAG: carboxypeptidase M32 [Nanoarchaeota archaeon]|nr:carboxypeptidase M32 [Nanoarchaeota archaeon]